MKTIAFFLSLVFWISTAHSEEPQFYRQLPPLSEMNKITADKFRDADAVIILKETAYGERTRTFSAWASLITGEWIATTEILIAKVLNDHAVSHFGSFEYEFADHTELYKALKVKAEFVFRARVMKPDSTVLILPDTSISTIDAVTASDDTPFLKKVIFKIPDVAPGDVVQIEQTHMQPFSDYVRRIFFYHDRYPILYSNLTIYVPSQDKFDFLSFPPEVVGKPTLVEDKNGWMYSWGVRNLRAIPVEAFAKPFGEVSYLTAMVKKLHKDGSDGWKPLVKEYLKSFADKRSVNKSFVEEIGLKEEDGKATWDEVEEIYTALRKNIRLFSVNSIYSGSDLRSVLDKRAGDATALANIMLEVLGRREVSATPLLIRDRRKGAYERSVSTLGWFDRMAVLVSLDGGEKVYDFDRSIPSHYEHPWYLHRTTVMALYDTGVSHLYVELPLQLEKLVSHEKHRVDLKRSSATDSVTFTFTAAHAQRMRTQLYPLSGNRLSDRLRNILEQFALSSAETTSVNDFRDERELRITGTGEAQASVSSIDSFIVFRPKNHLVHDLRSRFTQGVRHSDICFDEPFCYAMEWRVNIPAGFTPMHIAEQTTLGMDQGITSSIRYKTHENTFEILADLIVNTEIVQASKYQDLLNFLDKSIATIERDITFVRKH
ncbi:MAG: DUF3857 domain-containing protein [Ignavibacteriae bacterium]|nr:DUF3857 domain-containing protein [Ignavibacteriota bacterium]